MFLPRVVASVIKHRYLIKALKRKSHYSYSFLWNSIYSNIILIRKYLEVLIHRIKYIKNLKQLMTCIIEQRILHYLVVNEFCLNRTYYIKEVGSIRIYKYAYTCIHTYMDTNLHTYIYCEPILFHRCSFSVLVLTKRSSFILLIIIYSVKVI